jgi:hypothetical protein
MRQRSQLSDQIRYGITVRLRLSPFHQPDRTASSRSINDDYRLTEMLFGGFRQRSRGNICTASSRIRNDECYWLRRKYTAVILQGAVIHIFTDTQGRKHSYSRRNQHIFLPWLFLHYVSSSPKMNWARHAPVFTSNVFGLVVCVYMKSMYRNVEGYSYRLIFVFIFYFAKVSAF